MVGQDIKSMKDNEKNEWKFKKLAENTCRKNIVRKSKKYEHNKECSKRSHKREMMKDSKHHQQKWAKLEGI